MGETVNLNRVRKRRARQEKERRAAANRARTGLTKAERAALTKEAARRARELEGKRREPPGGTDE